MARPPRPAGLIDVIAAPALSLPLAAKSWRVEVDELMSLAEEGWLPSWAASKQVGLPRFTNMSDKSRWRFSSKLSQREAKRLLVRDYLWLHRVPADECDLTKHWVAEQQRRGNHIPLAAIAEWCRCAFPHALTASGSVFAMWCSDHDWGETITAVRLGALSQWFEMLRFEGVSELAESAPSDTTALRVQVV